ncbi:PP2C family protein-serine/threonine phosphatase [Desulfopila aestuarii]|uniref:Serine phosphatase RsbU, regulator of sigma subunit n=1 Tax=Desulfopila aestuarii DSM 18488 TaxID=1121416 RepID=A0A1M7YH37_9BACT|nr:PP2C family protein-serine/threonine phosphatase [Desulfopila aestuarii]SHO51930.1 Serine phosphatase RsbU, regulator of sigma subunit [Desulfopila aestuarii DSM 18488]
MDSYTYDRRQFSRHELSNQLIQNELALAGQIQRSFLPTASQCLKRYELAGQSISCIEVGGDYFDYLYGPEFQDESLKIIVGDVSGHGIDAALLMSSARTFLRARAINSGTATQVVSAMNRHFYLDHSRTGHFMTLFYLDINLDSGHATWVRAGHEPATVFAPSINEFHELKGAGVPLGVDYNYCYSEYFLPQLAEGTIIAIGTDGIWEARNENGKFFGKDRFKSILQETADFSAQEIINAVFDELGMFCRGVPLDDDVTLVIVKVV